MPSFRYTADPDFLPCRPRSLLHAIGLRVEIDETVLIIRPINRDLRPIGLHLAVPLEDADSLLALLRSDATVAMKTDEERLLHFAGPPCLSRSRTGSVKTTGLQATFSDETVWLRLISSHGHIARNFRLGVSVRDLPGLVEAIETRLAPQPTLALAG